MWGNVTISTSEKREHASQVTALGNTNHFHKIDSQIQKRKHNCYVTVNYIYFGSCTEKSRVAKHCPDVFNIQNQQIEIWNS